MMIRYGACKMFRMPNDWVGRVAGHKRPFYAQFIVGNPYASRTYGAKENFVVTTLPGINYCLPILFSEEFISKDTSD